MGLSNLFMKQERYGTDDFSTRGVGDCTANILKEWARSLPPSSLGILDMAAGQGFESSYLSKLGFDVSAYDLSKTMIGGAVYPVKRADLTNIRLRSSAYSGVLVKDAWVFLNQEQRSSALNVYYSALVHGGLILIMSQVSDTRAHIIPSESNLPISILESDFESNLEWAKYCTQEIMRGGKLVSIEYQTNESTMINEALQHGFSATTKSYPYDSQYARENRWVIRDQVVAILKK